MSTMYRRATRPAIALAAVAVVLTLALVASGCQPSGSVAQQRERTPDPVSSADALARRAVPGWQRAETQGLVVPVGVTANIPYTKASVTLDKAWYSGRQVYVLYTIRAPKGEYVMPTLAFLSNEATQVGAGYGLAQLLHLRTWGGFSPEGFHSVLVIDKLPPEPRGSSLNLEIKQWVPVSPEQGPAEQVRGLPITLKIPWSDDYLKEPAAQVYTLNEQKTWLARTVTLRSLRVGVGRTELTGTIQLPKGESNPGLNCRLQLGESVRDLEEFKAEPGSGPGLYEFVATFDGPDTWPAPVSLDLLGVGFQSDGTLEWRFPWVTKRNLRADDRLATLAATEQVSVQFYGSTLRTVGVWAGGVAVEQMDADAPAPRVVASLSSGGRMNGTAPGMEIATPSGQIVRDLGGGSGVVWDRPGRRNVQGVSAMWGETIPAEFAGADYLTLRYVHPSALMNLNEKWPLTLIKEN